MFLGRAKEKISERLDQTRSLRLGDACSVLAEQVRRDARRPQLGLAPTTAVG